MCEYVRACTIVSVCCVHLNAQGYARTLSMLYTHLRIWTLCTAVNLTFISVVESEIEATRDSNELTRSVYKHTRYMHILKH